MKIGEQAVSLNAADPSLFQWPDATRQTGNPDGQTYQTAASETTEPA